MDCADYCSKLQVLMVIIRCRGHPVHFLHWPYRATSDRYVSYKHTTCSILNVSFTSTHKLFKRVLWVVSVQMISYFLETEAEPLTYCII